MRIGVFHPGTQRIQEISLVFQELGWLVWCATGVYYKPDSPTYRWVHHIPSMCRQPILRELGKRRNARLADDKVVTHGAPEWTHLIAARLPVLRAHSRQFERMRTRMFGRWLADSPLLDEVDAVYGFNGMSLEVFRAAKAAGIKCILDQTSAYSGYNERLVREEAMLLPEFGRRSLLDRVSHLHWAAAREREELRLADLVVTGSEHSRRSLAGAGVDMGKVCIIGNVSTAPARLFEQRDQMGPLRLLYVGAVAASKGIRYLLDAMRLLEDIPVGLTLVGAMEVPSRDLLRYEGLFRYQSRVPRDQLWEIYESSHVFVFPSLTEGFARVLVEAASMGLPCVATTSSGGDELIGRDECGILVPPRDAASLASAVRRLCNAPDLRFRLSQAARERSLKFNFARYVDRIRKAVESFV
jgi:glycosyltransferase involved in cell wall biosynthesis